MTYDVDVLLDHKVSWVIKNLTEAPKIEQCALINLFTYMSFKRKVLFVNMGHMS